MELNLVKKFNMYLLGVHVGPCSRETFEVHCLRRLSFRWVPQHSWFRPSFALLGVRPRLSLQRVAWPQKILRPMREERGRQRRR
jgi:hypothetical protein